MRRLNYDKQTTRLNWKTIRNKPEKTLGGRATSNKHNYIMEVLDIFEMPNCNTVTNPYKINAKIFKCNDMERV